MKFPKLGDHHLGDLVMLSDEIVASREHLGTLQICFFHADKFFMKDDKYHVQGKVFIHSSSVILQDIAHLLER